MTFGKWLHDSFREGAINMMMLLRGSWVLWAVLTCLYFVGVSIRIDLFMLGTKLLLIFLFGAYVVWGLRLALKN